MDIYWLKFPKTEHGKTYVGQVIGAEPMQAASPASALRMIERGATQVADPRFSFAGAGVKAIETALADGLVTLEQVHAFELRQSSYRKGIATLTGYSPD